MAATRPYHLACRDSPVSTAPDLLGHLPAAAAYAMLAAAVLAESVLLIGAFVPTLALMLAAGALARAGGLHLALVIATAAASVICGDALAHRTGRLLGPRLRKGRLGSRIPDTRWIRAAALMDRGGGRAILICRFLPVIRTLAPHLAGAAGLAYRRIAPYSAIAAIAWAIALAGAGYAAASPDRLIAIGGTIMAAEAAIAGAGLAWAGLRRQPTENRR